MDKVIVSLNKETVESNNAELLLCEVVKYLKHTPKKDYDHYLNRLNKHIEDNKLKTSLEREHVLKTIHEIKQNFTYSDIRNNQQKPIVSNNTIINTVNTLVEAEILIIIPTITNGRVYKLN